MLDAPADALARHLLTVLPPERPRPRAELGRLPLPIAHYLGGVLDRRLAREAALPTSPWFDAETEAAQEAARAWRAATRDTARFPAEAWEDAVGDASRWVLRYLVEPAEALGEHVFAEASSLPVEAVRARMALFSPYPYLREITEGYFARKGVETVERDDFERLLRRIDRRMVSLFGPHDWLSLLEPLFDLLGPLSDGERVPGPALRRFFEAKGYDDLAHALDADAYDEAALRATLTAVLPDLDESGPAETEGPVSLVRVIGATSEDAGAEEGGEPEADERSTSLDARAAEDAEPLEAADEPVEAADEPVASAELVTPETAPEPLAVAEPAEDDRPDKGDREGPAPTEDAPAPEAGAPLWLRLAQRREEPPSPLSPPPQDEDAVEESASGAEPLWKRFAPGPQAAPGEQAASAPSREATPDRATERPELLSRLETRVLGPSATERRDWYVTHLLGGSEASYRAVLQQLDAATSWTAASQIIAREVFRKHHVNIYSDAAVAFTDAVEARYTRRA